MGRKPFVKRRLFWFISLSVLVLLIGGSVFWVSISDWTSPSGTLAAFCRALVAQDYATAYSHLSQDYQQVLPYTTFATTYRSNNGAGRVTACQGHVFDDNLFGSYARVDLTYANGTKNQQEFRFGTEYLIFWKILPGSV